MIHPKLDQQAVESLRTLLRQRLAIIGDDVLRSGNPELQLQRLKEVSEQIQDWHDQHRTTMPARLRHFLSQASFGKALDYLSELEA